MTVGTRKLRGKALLESTEIVFRGERRVTLRLSELAGVTADDDVLAFRHDGKRYTLRLGTHASKWAHKIKNPKGRIDKLGVKAGSRVAVLGVRDDAFARELRERGARIVKGDAELVFFGAHTPQDLQKIALLASRIRPDGGIWIVRPKGKTAVTERDTMAAGKAAGLVDVKVVAFSDTHTAEKFVIPVRNRRRE